ncbi:MAG: 4-hydroxy-tetrahydrodipicolinate reductase [Candidatus Puniceispirillaceae bacterium]
MSSIHIALPGAAGRMGQMIASLISESPQFDLTLVSENPDAGKVGADYGSLTGLKFEGLTLAASLAGLSQSETGGKKADVVIDFTAPAATMQHLAAARAAGTAMVIGTTGLSEADEAMLTDASKDIPIVYCANTSVGVTLLANLVREVARQLDESWDIEIVETHHNRKVDAPSGTALALGKAAAEGRSVDLDAVRDSGRDGITGARQSGDIGFAVMRGGDVAGEHSVLFFGEEERIELTHKATSRRIFGRGALKAAQFAASAKPGLYSMDDVLKA